MGSVPRLEAADGSSSPDEKLKIQTATRRRLCKVINLDDLEIAAQEVLPAKYFACEWEVLGDTTQILLANP
jgi:hypothetical protein